MPDNEAPLGSDGSQADSTEGQVSENTQATEPQNDEQNEDDDPVASLTKRLNSIEQDYVNTKRVVAQISSSAGRIPNLVKELQSLAAKNPLADIQPRIDEITDLLDATIDSLDDVAFKPGGGSTIAERRQAIVQKRAMERLRREVLDEVAPKNTTTATDDADDDSGIDAPVAEFAAAQARILGYAEAMGISVDRIPDDDLTFRAGETVADAERRVKAAIKAIADGDGAANRTAQRKQAAGNGSAPRSGGASTSDDALLTRFGNGEALSEDERKRVEKMLAGVLR